MKSEVSPCGTNLDGLGGRDQAIKGLTTLGPGAEGCIEFNHSNYGIPSPGNLGKHPIPMDEEVEKIYSAIRHLFWKTNSSLLKLAISKPQDGEWRQVFNVEDL